MSEVAGVIKYTIKVEAEVTTEMIDDLLVSAFEGGCDYWLHSVSVLAPYRAEWSSDHVAHGGSIYVYADCGRLFLSREMYLRALQEYCESKSMTPAEVHETHDAAVADTILQIALFGTEVYG